MRLIKIKWWKGPTFTWGGPAQDWYYWFVHWTEDRPFINHDGTTMNDRRFGFERFWYDHPHVQVKLWYLTFGWATPWTVPESEFRCKGKQIEDGWLTWDERIAQWMGKEVKTLPWARK